MSKPNTVLAIDSSQPRLCLALMAGEEMLVSIIDTSDVPHSKRLFPMLNEILPMHSLKIAQIDLLAVNTGPGSFTGLRVGLAAAKGLARSLGKPVVGVNCMDAMALAAETIGVPIAILLSASRGEVFLGLRWVEEELSVRQSVRWMSADQVVSLSQARRFLFSQFAERNLVLIGNGLTEMWNEGDQRPDQWRLLPQPDSLAPVICKRGLQGLLESHLGGAEAYYIRPSEAEIKHKK